jgi:ribonuclease Z
MLRYGASFALSDVFFSHFHADHFLGLIGLVRTLGLQGRTDPMRFFGPKGAKRILGAAMSMGMERGTFEFEIVEVAPGDVLDRGEYELRAYAAEHGGGALGWVLAEHDRLGRFNPDRARELGVPEGRMWGALQRSQSVTLEDGTVITPETIVGAPRPGRKLVYTGDTRPCAATIEAAAGADLLIHEATFGDEEAERAVETQHATAREAAQVAKMAGVKQLALTHLSARYSRDPSPLLAEARELFANAVIAKDGMLIDVPYAAEG